MRGSSGCGKGGAGAQAWVLQRGVGKGKWRPKRWFPLMATVPADWIRIQGGACLGETEGDFKRRKRPGFY
jgi:hypothetical protein